MKLRLLSGGAAQALVAEVSARLKAETGFDIDDTFGAVGAMKARLLDGDPADLLILTRALIEELADDGHVDRETIADIGIVRTAIAVRAADPVPPVGNADELRRALTAADAIYAPDLTLSTAGKHFAKVLGTLGIAGEVASRMREYPNGASAMNALAASTDARPIGCTQVTEILGTSGLNLANVLPEMFGLSTIYSLGVTTRTANRPAAATLAALLTSAEARPIRERVGFGR
jgi:molybdate transport system substrate-binding protein